jgi:predicted RNA binding protein YcfA (HicA-like mRNA interferase family)
MNAREVIKLLKENGWDCVRISGSHHIFEKDGKIVPVPVHSGDLKKGTLHSIMKMAGLK